jgi:MFS family permease
MKIRHRRKGNCPNLHHGGRGTTIAPARGMKKILLLVLIVSGCAPSYWVQESDLRRAWRGNVATIPATHDVGDDPLRLKAASLEHVAVDEDSGRAVRVTPHHPRLTAGWALLGIGAGLAVGAIVAGLTMLRPCTGDEECWVAQTSAASALAGFGGASLIIGGALAGTSRHEAEARN